MCFSYVIELTSLISLVFSFVAWRAIVKLDSFLRRKEIIDPGE